MTDPVPSKDLSKYTLIVEAREYAEHLKANKVGGYTIVEDLANEVERLRTNAAVDERLDRVERELAEADAARWRAYLRFYDREEMVAAEWDGPAAITAFIDSMRAAQPPGAGPK